MTEKSNQQARDITLAHNLEIWDLGRLAPNIRNARTHSEEQIDQIAGSMSAFGFMSPVLVDSAGLIIAGHGRLLAARRLRLKRIPVVIVDHLSDAQKRAYSLADNQIALNADWDEQLLRVELEAPKEDFELEDLGFSDRELNELLDRLNTEPCLSDDEAPEPQATVVTKTGEVWILGEHRLVCGDATDPAAYTAVLSGEKADMIFCDPPFNCAYKAPGLGVTIRNDDLGKDFGPFLESACVQMLQNTMGGVYICMSSAELHSLYSAFVKAGGHWSTFVIWGKQTFTLGRADYQRQFEPILYGWREGQPHYWCGARDQGDLWLIDRPAVNDLHPTMKPVELVERAILNSSRAGQVVLDPFAGAGSTLIACEKSRRNARVIEIEPCYCDVIVRRWRQFTGKQAVLESTGASFESVSVERADNESAVNHSSITEMSNEEDDNQ